jgi:Xaa-Pro aminopeptidase
VKVQFASRRNRLLASLKKMSIDAMLVTDPVNVRYLTGFTGDSSYLLLTKKHALFLTDTRYETQIQSEAPDLQVEVRDSSLTLIKLLEKTVKPLKLSHLGFEENHVSKATFDSISLACNGTALTETHSVVEKLRQIKDRAEIEFIRRSIDLAQRAYRVITAAMTLEQTELQIGHELEHQIRAFGGEECSFEPIIAVGDHAALPHAIKTARRVDESSFVLMDWGAKVSGYASDLTRVIATGRVPAKFEKIHQVVLAAQAAAIKAVRPGVSAKVVDAAARGLIAHAGFGKFFGHGLGHGFGLQIHELPRLSPINDELLEPGMVITIEPGIYLPGFGGVRIEDDILVTEDGCEVLSNLPKSLSECTLQSLAVGR